MTLSPARQALWDDRHQPERPLNGRDRSFLARERIDRGLAVRNIEINEHAFVAALRRIGHVTGDRWPDRYEQEAILRGLIGAFTALVTRYGENPLTDLMVDRPNRFAEIQSMSGANSDVVAMRKLLSGIDKPVAVAAAERALSAARHELREAEAVVRAREILLAERGLIDQTDGQLRELRRRLAGAGDTCRKARTTLEGARSAAAHDWWTKLNAATPEMVRLIDAALAQVMAVVAPVAEVADGFDTMNTSPPPHVAEFGRELHAWCAKKRAQGNAALPKLVSVRFLSPVTANAGAPDERSFEAGGVYELAEASARRWINHGFAQDADIPYERPTMVRVKFAIDYLAASGRPVPDGPTTFKAGETYAVEERFARQVVEGGYAEPIETTFWDSLSAGARSAAAAIGVTVPNGAAGAALEARRGSPRARLN